MFRTAYSGGFGQGGDIPLPTLFPPYNAVLRHNSVHAGRETLADDHATHCMNEVDSGDRIVHHINYHGDTSRFGRYETGWGGRVPAMPCPRCPPAQRLPF